MGSRALKMKRLSYLISPCTELGVLQLRIDLVYMSVVRAVQCTEFVFLICAYLSLNLYCESVGTLGLADKNTVSS